MSREFYDGHFGHFRISLRIFLALELIYAQNILLFVGNTNIIDKSCILGLIGISTMINLPSAIKLLTPFFIGGSVNFFNTKFLDFLTRNFFNIKFFMKIWFFGNFFVLKQIHGKKNCVLIIWPHLHTIKNGVIVLPHSMCHLFLFFIYR